MVWGFGFGLLFLLICLFVCLFVCFSSLVKILPFALFLSYLSGSLLSDSHFSLFINYFIVMSREGLLSACRKEGWTMESLYISLVGLNIVSLVQSQWVKVIPFKGSQLPAPCQSQSKSSPFALGMDCLMITVYLSDRNCTSLFLCSSTHATH
jgi:hypothetical protein